MKNKSLVILATSLMMTSLVGCGSETASNSTKVLDSSNEEKQESKITYLEAPSSGLDTSKEIEIVFYHTMNKDLQQVLEAYIEDFNNTYPTIKITHHAIGGYDDVKDQNTKAISSGKNDCDIAYCYPDHIATYNKAGSVYALDHIIDDQTYGFTSAEKSDFVDAYWQEGLSLGDGHMYCLPLSKSSEVMYYNKTFFEEHDLKVPTTWQDLFTLCQTIKDIDPLSIPLGYDSSSNLFITLCEQIGCGYTSSDPNNHYLFNNSAIKDVVSGFKSFFDLGYITTKTLYGAYTSGLFTEVGESAQKSYMSIGSSAGAKNQIPALDAATGERPFEVGIARIPQYDLNNGKVIEQGPDICIFNNGDEQKALASWLFVKFLTTSVEFQAQFSMTSGYTPVIQSVNDNQIYAEWLASADGYENLAALSTKTCVDQKDWYFTSPSFVGSSEARDQAGNIIDSVFSESKTLDEAFEDAIKACEAVS